MVKYKIGDKVSGLEILGDLGYSESHHRYYKCRCLTCGRVGIVPKERIRKNDPACKYCSGKITDHKGKHIDGYVVLHETEQRTISRNDMWVCKCESCGKEKLFSGGQISKGRLTTCGCKKWRSPNEVFAMQMQPYI